MEKEIKEYDENGNLIHCKNGELEAWMEYNEKGNRVYYKDTDGNEARYDNAGNRLYLDSSGNYTPISRPWEPYSDELFQKDYNNLEIYCDYDENGNMIPGTQYIEEKDKNGNILHYEHQNGFRYWKEYDEKGNIIHYKDSNGKEYWYEYEYYENGQLKSYKQIV